MLTFRYSGTTTGRCGRFTLLYCHCRTLSSSWLPAELSVQVATSHCLVLSGPLSPHSGDYLQVSLSLCLPPLPSPPLKAWDKKGVVARSNTLLHNDLLTFNDFQLKSLEFEPLEGLELSILRCQSQILHLVNIGPDIRSRCSRLRLAR